MAKTLVLEWDSREARVIAISQRGHKWTVEDAFALALPARDASAGDKVVGPILREALAQRGLSGSKCKLVVGRSSIELRYLTVPQAPMEEMPDLVRFAALRQFSQLGEEWPLDFIPVSDAGEAQLVLAASIVPSALDGLKDVCTQAGLTADQVYLRPFAAAANVADEAVAEGQERRLIVDVLTDEADLVVVDRGRPIFCRTVKLPVGAEAAEARNTVLVGEIRRTVAAAQNQIPGSPITHVSLFGVASECAAVLANLRQANFSVEAIDPFAEVDPTRITEVKASQRGGFAPLLGVMHLLSGASTPSIDFLHPRQRPLPPDNKRRNILAIAAAVMLALCGATGYYLWSDGINRQMEDLNSKLVATKAKLKTFDEVQRATTAVENLEKTNINLVERLARVSEKLPPGERAILTQLNITAPQITIARSGKPQELRGQVTLSGIAREIADITAIRKQLNELGDLRSDGGKVPSDDSRYPWKFDEKLFVSLAQAIRNNANLAPKPGSTPVKPAASKDAKSTAPAGKSTESASKKETAPASKNK